MIPVSKPLLGQDELSAVKEVLRSGNIIQGTKVREFEEQFARYIGTEYAIATNSGTSALHTALLAGGVKKGDEVITTPFTFIASANSILYVGAKPIFVDINEQDFNLDVAKISEKITNKTKAILGVHLFGQPCDVKNITDICNDHNLLFFEDACQAHGAKYGNKKVGCFGIANSFSFYPTKNMTTGEGGIITTDSKEIVEKSQMIRNHGQKEKYIHTLLGYNHRMTDIAAAIGICQLKKIERFNQARQKNAKELTQKIKGITGLIRPTVKPRVNHVFHQYTIRVTEQYGIPRDELIPKFKERGIGTGIHYPMPLHKQPLYKKLGYKDRLPVSEKICNEVLSLPVYPSVTRKNIDTIVRVLKDYA